MTNIERVLCTEQYDALIVAKSATDTPQGTIDFFIGGAEAPKEDRAQKLKVLKWIVATAVNIHAHDGRLSGEVVAWASRISSVQGNDYFPHVDSIHIAHLNQIAEALKNNTVHA